MVIATIAALVAAAAQPVSPQCADLLPAFVAAPRRAAGMRSVTPGDLVRLRDFGQIGAGYGNEALFTASPDQRSAALLLRRADPASNSYCQGLVIVEIATGRARLVDTGGELVRPTYAHNLVLAGFPMGVPMVITPSWSPDGQWLLLLKRNDGVTQAWRVRTNGGGAEQLTHEAQDVTAVAWSAAGRNVLFQTDRQLTNSQTAIDAEALTGWHYDNRYSPVSTARPYPRPSDPTQQIFSLDTATGLVAQASPDERRRLEETANSSLAWGGMGKSRGTFAEAASETPGFFVAPRLLRATFSGAERICREEACRKLQGFWVSPDGTFVTLLSRGGWGGGDQTFSRWDLPSGKLTHLSSTADFLMGCRPIGAEMLCARETSTAPRRLVIVDPVTGRSRTVFNPNPDYDRLRSGKVERLRLTSANGERTFADVMLPTDYVPGRRYPMVVVQYESRGFLRGGTGEEYPIPAFASAGMMVLSFQRPPDVAATTVPPPKTLNDYIRLDDDNWADRRNVHSALMNGVEQMVDRGIVDPGRLGITGLSDGLATTAFALLNSDRFSVAAVNGCCQEPINDAALQGPEYARMMAAAGLPPLSAPDPNRWSDYSIVQNARRVKAPLLIQSPDREFILSVPAQAALSETKLPVDLYVYPGEFHIKWQPAHKLAVYERALRWFEFWFDLPPLAGQQPWPAGERERWAAMRQEARTAGRLSPGITTSP